MKIIEGSTIKIVINIICVMTFAFQFIYGQDPPEFDFSQSTLQAFYFFEEVTLNGIDIEPDDWVAAFNGNICVGARQWDTSVCGGGICDVPAMGYDGGEYTAGYMQIGDIPIFKIYDASSGNIFEAASSEPVDAWSISGFSMNDLLEACGCTESCDDQTTWSVNSASFQYNGSITSKVFLNDNEVGAADDRLAAFVCDEIRGVVNGLAIPSELGGGYSFNIMIHSNQVDGETVEFAFYQGSTNTVISLNETVEFMSDMMTGNALSPFEFTGDIVFGCTDNGACNYNGDATDDDDSCEYTEDNYDCADNCLIDPDCTGECGGDADVDNCDVCDSDPSNDCLQDCAGEWGGSLVDDECGVCGGTGSIWYADTDEDGLGDPNNSATNCEQPEGYVADDLDSYPDCTSNIVDNCGECDGDNSTCTGCENEDACNTGEENECVYASTWYADIDEDNLGDINSSMESCEQPNGYVADSTDEEPDCITNDTDVCGDCGGNISDASNCLSIDIFYVNNFSIKSIYPNPFNPVVNIDLSIDIAGHLQLSVFTIGGIQIKTIYNGPSSIGESTFTWRPENRASGLYFISAVIDDQVKTKKVLFLK